jgi:hypothetical protein
MNAFECLIRVNHTLRHCFHLLFSLDEKSNKKVKPRRPEIFREASPLLILLETQPKECEALLGVSTQNQFTPELPRAAAGSRSSAALQMVKFDSYSR